MPLRPLLVLVSTFALSLGCATVGQGTQSRYDLFSDDERSSADCSQDACEGSEGAYETFNEDNYGNVSPYGSGSERSSAYYGTGSNSPEEPPERTPAEPSVAKHRPY